jgi:hypothetical protein
MPISYQNGKLYKIVCNVTDEVYIGSTCQPTVARRLAKHVDNYKEHKKGKRSNTTSFRIIERGDYCIYLIESFPCDSKDELTKREGEVIRQMKTECTVVNCVIPGRTKAEYRIDNADKIKADKQIYRENNVDKIKVYRETKYTCECGSTLCLVKKSRHIKTKKHTDFFESKNEPAN